MAWALTSERTHLPFHPEQQKNGENEQLTPENADACGEFDRWLSGIFQSPELRI